MAFRFLLSGFDTIECAYWLTKVPSWSPTPLDFGHLTVEKEILRASKSKQPTVLRLGTEEFLLASHGTGSGYPFLLQNDAFAIQCGEFNRPNFFVTYRSEALWHQGALNLHKRFLAWAQSVAMLPDRDERLSRVDFTFDYWINSIDFDEDHFVTLADKDNQHRKHRKVQTFTFGASPTVLRLYNKSDEIQEQSGKTWLYPLWGGQEDNVWRIEWEIRKEILRARGIKTFNDLNDGQGDVLRPLVTEHTSLRIPNEDSNSSRWPIHPLWLDLVERVASLNALGVVRDCDPQAALDERMMRCAIAMYGYLKRVAAIHGLQRNKSDVSKDDALYRLGWLMDRLHDPLTWESDVQRRMNEMRLGM